MAKIASLPSWERGLKSVNITWVNHNPVAPLVGAWIEIVPKLCDIPDPVSLPSWERGLKFSVALSLSAVVLVSLPSWERGLKFLPAPKPH